jgi:hypothetical protein
MIKDIVDFFDKLEDRIRHVLSRYPILYGIIGGVGVVLFWRGIWHTTDYFSTIIFNFETAANTIDLAQLSDGLTSILVGMICLLMTGLFVSNFIGNEIIISGLRGEKRLAEKTKAEIEQDMSELASIKNELKEIKKILQETKTKVGDKTAK